MLESPWGLLAPAFGVSEVTQHDSHSVGRILELDLRVRGIRQGFEERFHLAKPNNLFQRLPIASFQNVSKNVFVRIHLLPLGAAIHLAVIHTPTVLKCPTKLRREHC